MKSLEPSGFGETYESWVIRLRADYSRREKLARAMNASDFSSSEWPTAKAISGGPNSKREERGAGGPDLQEAAIAFKGSAWPTPSARDYKGANSADHIENGTGRKHMDQLPNFVEHMWSTPRAHEVGQYTRDNGDPEKERESLTGQAFSHRDQLTYPVGETSSIERRSLNPLFVEWLMGWPPGWTLLAWTDLGCSEMELSRWKAAMRSELLSLGSPNAPPPAQMSLFG